MADKKNDWRVKLVNGHNFNLMWLLEPLQAQNKLLKSLERKVKALEKDNKALKAKTVNK